MSAAEVIPGILLANREIISDSPALFDLTATILSAFGIASTEGMIGKNVLKA